MVRYLGNAEKNVMDTYDLPSTPGAQITMPTRVGRGRRKEIESNATKVRGWMDDEGTERQEAFFDAVLAGHELFLAMVLDPRTHHNLEDADGNLIRITPEYVAAIGGAGMDEVDVEYMEHQVMSRHWDQTGAQKNPTLAPPAHEASPKPNSKNGKPTSKQPSEPLQEDKLSALGTAHL